MLNKVVEITAMHPFRLRVVFSDGARGVQDFSELVAESGFFVEPLRDPSYFARVHLEFGAPTWPNSFDMCPDWLRAEMERCGTLAAAPADAAV